MVSDYMPLQHIFSETSAIPSLASTRIQRWVLLFNGHTASSAHHHYEEEVLKEQ